MEIGLLGIFMNDRRVANNDQGVSPGQAVVDQINIFLV
jgi:hypothetical protein